MQSYLEKTFSITTDFYEQTIIQNLWGILISIGYLTIEERIGEYWCRLSFPNDEAKGKFKSLTASCFENRDF